MDEHDELHSIDVLQIHAGDGDGAELICDFNSQRVAVSVFPGSSPGDIKQSSLQDHLIHLLGRAASGDVDSSEYEQLLDETVRMILDAGRITFKAHATQQGGLTSSPQDLHSVLYPATLYCQFRDDSGKAIIVPIAPEDGYTIPPSEDGCDSAEEDDLSIDKVLPCYFTKSILPKEMFVHGLGHAVCRALVDGTDMFCKALGNTRVLGGTSVGRELACLQELQKLPQAGHDASIRIPRLLGYIRHSDTGRVVGFLRQWIPGTCLTDVEVGMVPVQTRQKWMRQIRDSVYTLHADGRTWGDGKASSHVIIDSRDDAWLIGFGAGWIDGWVGEDIADAMERDEHAISEMKEFLELDS
ncbi:hypothetical protein NLU13_8729 [Sarocladium strictum]|uniref:Uncharacterized protein n=1 Tax=Sarocladium strictum TaxID=5046 RepID=A0AA39GDF2_SARSR|nr:hypothetical protein NLU13_8729 [Sarocladium strictum]